MNQKSLYRKAFVLFFCAVFFMMTSIIGVGMLFVSAIKIVPWLEMAMIVSLLFAWGATRHPESLSEEIRQWKAEELVDEAWQMFLCYNALGWAVLLWRRVTTAWTKINLTMWG